MRNRQDDPRVNISINVNLEKNVIKGRRLDSSTNAKLVVNPRDILNQEHLYKETNNENDILLSNLPPSTKPKTKKKKKRTKKPKSKSPKQLIAEKNKEIRIMNAIKTQKCKKPPKPNVLPWGLNQERLKNYIIGEQVKQYNIMMMQRQRIKSEVDSKARRDQLGVSFLNQMQQGQVKNKIKKSKTLASSTTKTEQRSKNVINQEEIKMYKQYKAKLIVRQKQFEKQVGLEKQIKIQQNLNNLSTFIKRRNRSMSCDHQKTRKKRRAMSSHTYQNEIIYEDQKESITTDRMIKSKQIKKPKKKKIVLQYRNQSDSKRNQQHYSHNESVRQPNSSIFQYISNSSSGVNIPNESDPEQNIGNLDDSFYSKKLNLVTLGDQNDMVFKAELLEDEIYSSQREWDEQDLKEIREIRSIEQAANKVKGVIQISEKDEMAAIKIQKVWRGYKTRQILNYYLECFTQEEQDQELDLNQLTQSQINELMKQGGIDFHELQQQISRTQNQELHRNTKIEVDQSASQRSSHNSYSYKNERSIGVESANSKGSFYKNYIEDFNEISQRHFEIDQPIIESNRFKKQKKKLSIDVEEIEKEYNKQQQVDVGEMRQAFGSESLLKSLSVEQIPAGGKTIFEQRPFQEFTVQKYEELISREKMDELIKAREQVLQDRHHQQKKLITDALHQNRISPRTYDIQSKKLEKWVTKQKSHLSEKKKDIERGQQSTYETVMRTQRDLQFMKQMSQSNSQSYIKVIDSFSQDSIVYSEASLKNSSIIDIQLQNSNLQKQYLNYEEDLSRSQIMEEEIIFHQCSPSLTQMSEPDQHPEAFNLQKLAQSQMLRVSDIVSEQNNLMSEKQADSYSIVITNMIIASEIQALCSELSKQQIDLFEVINKAQFQYKPPKKSKGIKTNIQSVKSYLQYLSNFIQGEHQNEIINQLNIPVGPSSTEMLKFLHYNNENASSQFDSSIDSYSQNIILNAELFKVLEKNLVDQQIIKTNDVFLSEIEHIHNKAVFDCLNEALDYQRPYGIGGQPFIWKTDPQKLQIRKKTPEQLPSIIQKGQDKVVEWCQCLVGIIIDKEDSPFPKVLMFDQEYLAQIKEDRMIRMLQQEVIDTDERWINYDEEHTEVEVDLADAIFDDIMAEFVEEMAMLSNN